MNKDIRCIIIDDEIPGLDYIRMLCSQINGIEVVKCFNDPAGFLQEVSNFEFDVCLLDIQMPDISGLQLSQLVSGKPVIFISAHSQFAADAFDINAIDFLRKPVSKERLEKALNKVRDLIKNKQITKDFYTFNSQKGISIVYFDEIFYITTDETEKRDKLAYLSNGSKLILKNISLENLLEILPTGQFSQINKRDIVSIKAVQYINQNEITLKIISNNNQPFQVILSDVYKQSFLHLIKS